MSRCRVLRGRALARALQLAGLGKRTQGGLYVHRGRMRALPAELRGLVACAAAVAGQVPGANVVKLRRDRPQVSFLSYPGYERERHPKLAWAVTVDLERGDATRRVYGRGQAPAPILHKKRLLRDAW